MPTTQKTVSDEDGGNAEMDGGVAADRDGIDSEAVGDHGERGERLGDELYCGANTAEVVDDASDEDDRGTDDHARHGAGAVGEFERVVEVVPGVDGGGGEDGRAEDCHAAEAGDGGVVDAAVVVGDVEDIVLARETHHPRHGAEGDGESEDQGGELGKHQSGLTGAYRFLECPSSGAARSTVLIECGK